MKLTVNLAVILSLVAACAEDVPKYSRGPEVSPSVGEGGSAGERARSPAAAGSGGALGEAGSSESSGEAGARARSGAGENGESRAGGAGAGTQAPECDSDGDCAARECEVADCREGRCEYQHADAGEACGTDQELSCNGSGGCVECLDDDECGSDGPCSAGNCTAQGSCDQRLLEEGQSCDDGVFCNGSETCDGHGACGSGNEPCPEPTVCDEKLDQCVGCVDGGDCPQRTPTCSAAKRCICTQDADCAIADECRVGRCDLATGSCDVVNVEAGTSVGSQLVGDCRERQCNGSGAAVIADDDDDVPDDPAKPCLRSVCRNGEVGQAPRPSGTECGAGATECSGADSCDSEGVCQPNHIENGTVVRTETKTDCRRRSCDGSGSAEDTPVSAVCNDNSFCSGTESCSGGGVCQSAGDPCAGTSKPYCVASACQACSMDSQCSGLGGRQGHCVGTCVECTDATLAADCGGPASDLGCEGGRCYAKCCSLESCSRTYSLLCSR